VPQECFERDLATSMGYLAMSALLTGVLAAAAHAFIPLSWWALPAWALYAAACGTAATGLWVITHECGHGAFSESRLVNDGVGFLLHSAMLVPYFAWQRTHALHHSNTNHMERGQTHVPKVAGQGSKREGIYRNMEKDKFAWYNAVIHLVLGWPAYLLAGESAGPAYAPTGHFWPHEPVGAREIDTFPGQWKHKVLLADAGVAAALCLLAYWASQAGVMTVFALYGGPYLVVNAWLVTITWLQHTHHDLHHFGQRDFTWVKGAFSTVDRDWGCLLDVLHHRITTTHVAHHVCERIPHYHAVRATEALRKAFPELCLRDDTPLLDALLGTARACVLVEPLPGTADTYHYPRRR